MPLKLHPPARPIRTATVRERPVPLPLRPATLPNRHTLNALAFCIHPKAQWQACPGSSTAAPPHAKTVFFTRHKHHYISFRQLASDQIGIIAILHENQDIPNRLKNDMDQL